MARAGNDRRKNLYEAAVGQDLQNRIAKHAPLARGVQGRDQAIMNLTPTDRGIAMLKTKMRAVGMPVPRRVN